MLSWGCVALTCLGIRGAVLPYYTVLELCCALPVQIVELRQKEMTELSLAERSAVLVFDIQCWTELLSVVEVTKQVWAPLPVFVLQHALASVDNARRNDILTRYAKSRDPSATPLSRVIFLHLLSRFGYAMLSFFHREQKLLGAGAVAGLLPIAEVATAVVEGGALAEAGSTRWAPDVATPTAGALMAGSVGVEGSGGRSSGSSGNSGSSGGRSGECTGCSGDGDNRGRSPDGEKAQPGWLEQVPLVNLARAAMSCAQSEISALPRKLEPFTEMFAPKDALAVVAAGRWTSEFGPMVTQPGPEGEEFAGLDALGLQRPPWRSFKDVCEGTGGDARRRIRRTALLSCGDRMANSRVGHGKKPAGWVFDRFSTPRGKRENLLNCIHFVRQCDTHCSAGERLASLPETLRESNLATRWWPESNDSMFALFSMAGTSMSYHIDLWATAVFYTVLWGSKLFVVAPPTVRNLALLRSWQKADEDTSHERFPGGTGDGIGGGRGGGT